MPEQTDEKWHDLCAFETQIAARLRNTTRTERMRLYNEVYSAYFEAYLKVLGSAQDHPGSNAAYELAFAKRYVSSDSIVAKIGPGQCELAIALATYCKCICAVDVIDLSPGESRPVNFRHVLTNGIQIPLLDDSVDIVISNQLMEHLHPDDATDQLQEIFRILRPGGSYICVTPNRLHGPHDSSARFDDLPCPIVDGTFVANGLHLKEYTNFELFQLFRSVGFRRTRHFAGARGVYFEIPAHAMILAERWARRIPLKLRKRSRSLQVLFGARVVADK
jgi:SAM-dependent methyltransferase